MMAANAKDLVAGGGEGAQDKTNNDKETNKQPKSKKDKPKEAPRAKEAATAEAEEPAPAPTPQGQLPDPFDVQPEDGVSPAPEQDEEHDQEGEKEKAPTPRTEQTDNPFNEGQVQPIFKAGDKVKAKYMARGTKYPGVIDKVLQPGTGELWVHVVCTKFMQMHQIYALHKIYAFAQNVCICTKFMHCTNVMHSTNYMHCTKFVQYGMCGSSDGRVAGTQKWQDTHTTSFLMMVTLILR